MSSGTVRDMHAAHKAIEAAAPRVMSSQEVSQVQRKAMSPRQQKLDWLWSWYKTTNYDSYKFDWNGQKAMDPVERDHVFVGAFTPPGFYDGGQTQPLKLRRPDTPSGLGKLIVDRFTSMLFAARTHPRVTALGDPDTEDYAQALAEACKLWSHMDSARTYGGAMGSIAVGFKFLDGTPVVELHDPRYTRAEFVDRGERDVKRIEKRYIYAQEDFDPETGEWSTTAQWYRRVIDQKSDIVYAPEWVGDGEEPDWKELERVDHNLGFCPVVWIQNLPVDDSPDGLSDAHGCYDLIKAHDMMMSQAHKGTLANSDPTLILITDIPLQEIRKGSDNAIQLPVGSDGKYLTLSGDAAKAALDQGQRYREQILELAEVVLPGGSGDDVKAQTATEVERRYAAMLAKADRMRVQYGDRGALKLLNMMLRAIRKLNERADVDAFGNPVVHELNLPPKIIPGKDGAPAKFAPRKLGKTPAALTLKWPRYFQPSLLDAQLAVGAAGNAKLSGLVDTDHAVGFVAEYFQVDDVQGMLDQIDKEKAEDQKELMEMGGGMGGGMMAGQPGSAKASMSAKGGAGMKAVEGKEEL